MNDTGAPSAWSSAEQFDPMGAQDQPDFSLLDFENIDLDFGFGNSSSNDTNQQLGQLAEELNIQHLHNPFSPTVSQEHRNGPTDAQQQHQQRDMDGHGQGMAQTGSSFFDFSIPPYMQNTPAFSQPNEHTYRSHGPVPPTPNSIEMHGDPGRYMQQMDAQQTMFEQRYQMRKGDTTFTPLVSPAVTPHEARFRVQEMTTVPGAYFSPLTSPALNAQNHPHAPAYSSQYATSGSSAGASPNDVDMDMLEESAMSQQEQGRKLRSANKRSAPRSSATPARIRQSPIVKPGRRKATVSSLIPKEVSELLDQVHGYRPPSSGIDMNRSRESSMADSISPEPLCEMGPPPKPGSVTQSPAMLAQNQQASGQGVAPATPASLMRIHPSPTFNAPDVPPMLDDLTLPEASLDRPPLTRLDTTLDNGEDTPRLSARKTPKLGILSTPSAPSAQSGRPSPAQPSPMLSAVSTPASPAFSAAMGKRGDPKSGRGSKKRNSVSSNLVSPALRPKISPSIKPLLPGGAQDGSGDTHALLLASKSNYQNILDGTTVPGVVYPTSLSTNLTSKRTSHKIAEQGRRNRINTALQEMQALLPPSQQVKEGKSPDNSVQSSNNSKAAKVESAIDYIKELQKEVSDKDKMLADKDREMEELRKELAVIKQGSSICSPFNVQTASPTTQENAPSQENAT
ncbi:hypothetical protein K458DRAFT_286667 [Lentithecium fluviatile CBS 122367]|uniref:BHLH domain-containing protein n=1 Tax=Lentithecium fluviatile CBS 122367 TaxID=1168545 RepID=A0A6G1JMH4_9PLEO|nr:hypothetical protein K458DRAFT_286667 [Lentithecium fluviatile CBS 122367]